MIESNRASTTVKTIRPWGSKFLNELQSRGSGTTARNAEKSKVYDINMTEESPAEEAHATRDDDDDGVDMVAFSQRTTMRMRFTWRLLNLRTRSSKQFNKKDLKGGSTPQMIQSFKRGGGWFHGR